MVEAGAVVIARTSVVGAMLWRTRRRRIVAVVVMVRVVTSPPPVVVVVIVAVVAYVPVPVVPRVVRIAPPRVVTGTGVEAPAKVPRRRVEAE